MKEIALALKNVKKTFKKSSFSWQSLKGAVLRREVFKTFKNVYYFDALKDINLEIFKGETFGIIGENGAGKSTILKIFAKILKPNEGEVFVNGKLAPLIELGAGFHPEISGEENIIINGIILGLKKKEILKLLPSIVEFSELGEFIKEPVKIYSSGMYARLGFSIAIHTGFPILLIDEVLAVGDEHFSKKCLLKIKEIQKEGKTIVLVSHDMDLVKNICHRVCLLEKGRIKKVGAPEEVVNLYLSIPPLQEKKEVFRFGDKRAFIEKVEIEEIKDGSINSEDKATISIHFKNPMLEKNIVFGIAIYRENGELVYGTNTEIDKVEINIMKSGVVSFFLPKLNLPQGSYYLEVAIHSKEGIPYDWWKKCLSFNVISEKNDIGGFRPEHFWKIK